MKLFPQIPESLEALSIDELKELLGKFRDAGTSILKKTADFSVFGEVTDEERARLVVDEFTTGTVAIKQIEAELESRTEGESNLDETLAELGAEAGLTADEPEVLAESDDSDDTDDSDDGDESDKDEPSAEADAEPAADGENKVEVSITADGERRVEGTKRLALPATPRDHMPALASQVLAGFVASAGIPGMAAGQSLTSEEIRQAFISMWSSNTTLPPGSRDSVKVASANYARDWPEERKLTGEASDRQKILDVVGPDAFGFDPITGERTLIASGGICALPTPLYDVAGFGRAMRPVRDALPSFNATRGGIAVAGGITISDINQTGADSAIGIVTAAEDEVGGTTGAKTCWHIDCPEFTDTFIQAIYQCLEFGNFNARTWPELIDRMVSETRAAHARLAETAMLDAITAGSTLVTQAKKYGVLSTILMGTLQAAAGFRSRHRTDPNLRFRALLPAWLLDETFVDLMHSEENRLDITRDQVTALLRRGAIEPTWYVDGATGDGQVFDAQSANVAVDEFPDHAFGYVFPEGTWLHLDGGTLDLGVVRDQELNLRNDYAMFVEDFENVAFIGVESLKIDFTVCPDGTTAPKGTAITC